MALVNKGEFFDYDPVTGVTEYFREDADGKCHITYEQDVTKALEVAKFKRNLGMSDQAWSKQGVASYAEVPLAVALQAQKNHGINFMDPNHTAAFVSYVNTYCPFFKNTDKHHEVK
jgi:hypothetical protein